MAFGVGDSLSVSVSADTADFMAGAEAVESKLGDLSSESIRTAAALEILSNRADDAGDNISQAGNKATVSSGQFSALSAATNVANSSFLGISATTYGALIPAIVALGAALAPVIASLGGFVAIAGSIVGVGLIPAIAAIATNTEVLKSSFTDLTETLGRVFQPVISEATFVLLELMDTFQGVASELVPSGEVIDELGGLFEELGVAVIEALPAFVDLATSLATEFLPPFVEFVEDILPDVPGIIRDFVDIFSQMVPRFTEAADALGEFLPELTEFGFTVLDVLGPALEKLAEIGTDVLEWLNDLSPAFQNVAAAGALLAPVVTVLASLLGPLTVISGIGAAISSSIGIVTTALSGVASIATTLIPLISSIGTALGTVAGIITATVGVALNLLSGALAGVPFTSVLTSLGGMIGSLTSVGGTLVAVLGPIGLVAAAIGALGYVFKNNKDLIINAVQTAFDKIRQLGTKAFNWLKNKGPKLAKKGMRAIGEGIRFVALDIYNAITGNDDSILKSTIVDIASWLRNRGPVVLKKAAKVAFDVIMAAAKGLYQGLIGNSLFPDMIQDIASYLRNEAVSKLKSAAKSLFNGVKNAIKDRIKAIKNLMTQLVDDITNFMKNDAKDALKDAADFMISGVKSAFESISLDIEWPEPPDIIQKAFEGDLNIDWPEPPDPFSGGNDGEDDDDDDDDDSDRDSGSGGDTGGDDTVGDGDEEFTGAPETAPGIPGSGRYNSGGVTVEMRDNDRYSAVRR